MQIVFKGASVVPNGVRLDVNFHQLAPLVTSFMPLFGEWKSKMAKQEVFSEGVAQEGPANRIISPEIMMKFQPYGPTAGYFVFATGTNGVADTLEAVTLMLTGLDKVQDQNVIEKVRSHPALAMYDESRWYPILHEAPQPTIIFTSQNAANNHVIHALNAIATCAFLDQLGIVESREG